MREMLVSAASLLAVALVSSAEAGDPEAGREVYLNTCVSCHSMECNRRHYGPGLGNLLGRPAATFPDFPYYTDALRDSQIVWDVTTLDRWLADPAALVPGTSMGDIAGIRTSVPDAEDRRNLIAYLLTGDTSLGIC